MKAWFKNIFFRNKKQKNQCNEKIHLKGDNYCGCKK